MVIEEKKLWFKTLDVILEDEAAVRLATSDEFARVRIISHTGSLPIKYTHCFEKSTGLIDLRKTPDEVLSNFKKTTRNEIARTFRDKRFTFVERKITREAYELYVQFEQQLGRKPFPLKHFSPCIEFAALHDDKLEGVIWVYPSTPILRIRSIFSSRRFSDDETGKRIGYETRRLIYDICLWGITHDRAALDLASVDPNATKNKGIHSFKLSFNPKIVGEYTYIRSSRPYSFFEKIRSHINTR